MFTHSKREQWDADDGPKLIRPDVGPLGQKVK